MLPLPLRACASFTVNANDLEPALVPLATAAENEKTPSPGVTSPFEPLSKNCWEEEPPIELRFAVTARPVLAGFVPGAVVTFNSVVAPAKRLAGLADPTP